MSEWLGNHPRIVAATFMVAAIVFVVLLLWGLKL